MRYAQAFNVHRIVNCDCMKWKKIESRDYMMKFIVHTYFFSSLSLSQLLWMMEKYKIDIFTQIHCVFIVWWLREEELKWSVNANTLTIVVSCNSLKPFFLSSFLIVSFKRKLNDGWDCVINTNVNEIILYFFYAHSSSENT
jgi:hypothetical protein